MNTKDRVAVCSRSFSHNLKLREELLARYANVKFNDAGVSLSGNQLVDFLRGYDKVITALEKIDEAVLSQLPELRVISKYGVGLDMIDMEAMCRHGKSLGWTGGINRRSVSEMVISFAVSMLRHFPQAHRDVLAGNWRQHIGGLLSNKTIGIIGCGFIGKDLIKLLEPWGCTILVNDILEFPDFYSRYNVIPISLEELLRMSDVVTLHTPLNESTVNLISAERLNMMKAGSILINAARGGLVDEMALKTVLLEKRIAAAAFDVFRVEPPKDRELLCLQNFLVTPHIGGSAEEAIIAMGLAAIDGLENNEIPVNFGSK